MKPTISVLIFYVFLTLPGFAQTNYRMVVSDVLSRKGIPYATIKVINKPDGTYADESGRFEVKILAKDSLLVTCIGYRSKMVAPNQDTIFLNPVVVNLDEVKVRSKKAKECTVGLADSKKDGTFYFCGNIHTETSILISIPDSFTYYRIKGIKFNSKHENGTSLIRLHIYSQGKDGMPDKELLPEDVIINKYLKSNGQIDMSRFNLILNNRVLFVGLENIESNTKFSLEKGECIGLGFTYSKKQNLSYHRSLHDPKFQWYSTFYGIQRKGNPENLMVSLIID
jgi:hypothetical protein